MESNDRKVTQFTTLGHAIFHTYELSVPLFIVLWRSQFDVSLATLGLIVGAGYGLIGLGAPVSGVLSDRYGSRLLIIASILGMGTGFALLSVATGVVTLTVAILVWGAFASIYHPAGLSLISRVATERGTVFAYHGAGGNVGTALGPLCTALLLSFSDWRTTALVLLAPALVAAAVGFRIEFDTHEAAETTTGSLAAAFRRSIGDARGLFTAGFAVAFVAVLLYGTYYRGLLTFLPDILGQSQWLVEIELFDRTFESAEYVYTAMLTVGIAGQYAGGKLTDRIPSRTAFLSALVSLVVAALLFPLAWEVGLVPLLVVTLALGFLVYGTAPVYQVVIAEQAEDDVHGLSYGFTYLAMFGIGAIGASVAGTVLTYATTTNLFVVLAALAAAGCGCLLVLRRY